ncbi:hypothetical protein F5Y10DRAFT_293489 [Nemania abortiva]|nr:hypothetical protein F5Y10DRAFT_293489 [Nemania abortiva]
MERQGKKIESSPVAARDAAVKQLHDLVTSPWSTKSPTTVSNMKFHIQLLDALDGIEIAELQDIVNSIAARRPLTDPETDGTSFAAQINDTKNWAKKAEATMTRIIHRRTIIEKLHQRIRAQIYIYTTPYPAPMDRPANHIFTNDCLRDPMANIVDDGFQHMLSGFPLGFPYVSSLRSHLTEPVPRASTTSSMAATTATSSQDVTKDAETQALPFEFIPTENAKPKSKPKPEPKPEPKPKPPVLGIWDSEEERREALRCYSGSGSIPLVFEHGVQFQPTGSSTASPSRMVIFSGLHPETTYSEVLSHVRGGAVLRISRADATTTFVHFANGTAACTYVLYINIPSRPRLQIRGRFPKVTLAPTPSYPVRASLAHDAERGTITRCLALPYFDAQLQRKVNALFTHMRIWPWVEAKRIETQTSLFPNPSGDNSDRDASESPEEWIDVEEKSRPPICIARSSNEPPPPLYTTKTFYVSFREITYAERTCKLLFAHFPTSGVHHVHDPCARPLSELDAK